MRQHSLTTIRLNSSRKRLGFTKLMNLLPRGNERLLRRVFGQMKIAEYRVSARVRHILKGDNDPLKGLMLFPNRRLRAGYLAN